MMSTSCFCASAMVAILAMLWCILSYRLRDVLIKSSLRNQGIDCVGCCGSHAENEQSNCRINR